MLPAAPQKNVNERSDSSDQANGLYERARSFDRVYRYGARNKGDV